MININNRIKIAACAAAGGGAAAYLLDTYVKMAVSNPDLHFLFGYLDGVIVMGLIMICAKHHSTNAPSGGK